MTGKAGLLPICIFSLALLAGQVCANGWSRRLLQDVGVTNPELAKLITAIQANEAKLNALATVVQGLQGQPGQNNMGTQLQDIQSMENDLARRLQQAFEWMASTHGGPLSRDAHAFMYEDFGIFQRQIDDLRSWVSGGGAGGVTGTIPDDEFFRQMAQQFREMSARVDRLERSVRRLQSSCLSNDDCELGSYCNGDACGSPGKCEQRPNVDCHPVEGAAVCGCDLVTYGSPCEAALAGARVLHQGPCVPCSRADGSGCPDAQFCFSPSCSDAAGVCRDRVDVCPAVWEPVCGCDGQTYMSACAASMVGQLVAYDGQCQLPCGGTSGASCPSHMFCQHAILVASQRDMLPVTGAQGPGARGNASLVCDPATGICHEGSAELPCERGSYGLCDNSPFTVAFAGCGREGVCQWKPESCPGDDLEGGGSGCVCDPITGMCPCADKVVPTPVTGPVGSLPYMQPVCGCDGRTYPSSCHANRNGTRVIALGSCPYDLCRTNADCDAKFRYAPHFCFARSCGGDLLGKCLPVPDVCPPRMPNTEVCDCDGNTQGSICEAAKLAKSISSRCPCGTEACKRCGSNGDCGAGEYCRTDTCGAPGQCVPLETGECPQTLIATPMCGCDLVEYPSLCEMAKRGVSLLYEGRCGARCVSNGDCAGAGEICHKALGKCGGIGTCRATCREAVVNEVDPDAAVCGCDGVSYRSRCDAADSGKQGAVAYLGECRPCEANSDCGPDDAFFCKKAACGQAGVCSVRPPIESCPVYFGITRNVTVDPTGSVRNGSDAIWYNPVCGCDGRQYADMCAANAAGTNVFASGQCPYPNGVCVQDADCTFEGQFCYRAPGQCSGRGICRSRSTVDCRAVVATPVCTCGGRTVSSCDAAVNGWNIAYEGVCQVCQGNDDCFGNYIPRIGVDGLPASVGGLSRYCHKDVGECASSGICLPPPLELTCVTNASIALPPPENGTLVCGCDGQNYANECLARSLGQSLAAVGPCSRPVPCLTQGDCQVDEFCHTASCMDLAVDRPGVCTKVPDVCHSELLGPALLEPVCGCDGVDYPSLCDALKARTSVAQACACALEACPRPCASNADCESSDYCATREGALCGSPAGVCTPRPGLCTAEYSPVCGCDGVTYPNSCDAASAGANVASRGPCPSFCAGNDECPQGQFCAFGNGTCGGRGLCRDMPLVCPADINYVCGCNGVDYMNPCAAGVAGVSVAYYGPCRPCASNADCPADTFFCLKSECQSRGRCNLRPSLASCPSVVASDTLDALPGTGMQLPPSLFNPVCGCDGVTYGGKCMAYARGVSVASPGPCEFQGEACAEDSDCNDVATPSYFWKHYCARPVGVCGGAGVCREKNTTLICAILPPPPPWPINGTGGGGFVIAPDGTRILVPDSVGNFTGNYTGTYTTYPGNGTNGTSPLAFVNVCTCDGRTLTACDALHDGLNVMYEGACQVCRSDVECLMSGGLENDNYPTGGGGGGAGNESYPIIPGVESRYCLKQDGDCGGVGVCATPPPINSCPQTLVYEPWCGCDGSNYNTRCGVHAAGESVRNEGVCGACAADYECGVGQVCARRGCGASMTRECMTVSDCQAGAPVCSCDNVTYASRCEADRAGASIASRGECSPPPPPPVNPPCNTNADCVSAGLPGSFCRRPTCPNNATDGAAGSPPFAGVCFPKPSITTCFNTTTVLNASSIVCGCDGMTYRSACFAASAGVVVRSLGVCVAPPPNPSECKSNADCPAASFCAKRPGEGCFGTGVCTPRPETCLAVEAPVCSCDGVQYSNPCAAWLAGANIAYNGTCRLCTSNAGCELASSTDPLLATLASIVFCKKAGSAPCDASVTGVCSVRPPASTCPQTLLPDPHCGCDGVQYNSYCNAWSMGVNVRYPGACNVTLPCVADEDCGDVSASFCYKRDGCYGAGLCARRQRATCEPTPGDEVCTCGGVTISACYIARGFNVAYRGPCMPCLNNTVCETGIRNGFFCLKPDFNCTAEGRCAATPPACPADATLTPSADMWCACNGTSYFRRCGVLAAGQSVADDASCPAPLPGNVTETGNTVTKAPAGGNCTVNTDCQSGLVCSGLGCTGYAKCLVPFATCPQATSTTSKVCGCDGRTYNSTCFAIQAGVRIRSAGQCPA